MWLLLLPSNNVTRVQDIDRFRLLSWRWPHHYQSKSLFFFISLFFFFFVVLFCSFFYSPSNDFIQSLFQAATHTHTHARINSKLFKSKQRNDEKYSKIFLWLKYYEILFENILFNVAYTSLVTNLDLCRCVGLCTPYKFCLFVPLSARVFTFF